MIKKIFIGISAVLHIVVFVLFSKNLIKMNILYLLAFCYAPIIISLLLCAIDTYINKTNHSIIYSVINILYLIVANKFVANSEALDTIYKNSQKYSSTNVNVSLDSSPILSLILLCVISTVLHIGLVKFMNKKMTSKIPF
ncbi:hypothetical protein LZ906_015940 (plasmid) [Paraclostridium ghonii]|uniref:hypothetical protein n=1 Tax=Paraclostridium ghonii TaxID=29358 RepID=UPI00202CF665|nr:hypothetical protein [Paeniclostridium ghonii]MCM0165527.1 hypothetical protein [Paeniclostridium ghonii]